MITAVVGTLFFGIVTLGAYYWGYRDGVDDTLEDLRYMPQYEPFDWHDWS